MAETSGLSRAEVEHLVVFPDLVKAHCSMIGAWGSATSSEYSDSLVQLRALDWATNSPLQQWPLVTVYHTSDRAYSTLGWPLFIGALTGMSSSIGVCEKVGSIVLFCFFFDPFSLSRFGCLTTALTVATAFPLLCCCATFSSLTHRLMLRGSESRRPSARAASGLESALRARRKGSQSLSTPRTWCGDSMTRTWKWETRHIRSSLISCKFVSFFLWFLFKNRLFSYVDKHVQPSGDPCMGSALSSFHGEITPRALVQGFFVVLCFFLFFVVFLSFCKRSGLVAKDGRHARGRVRFQAHANVGFQRFSLSEQRQFCPCVRPSLCAARHGRLVLAAAVKRTHLTLRLMIKGILTFLLKQNSFLLLVHNHIASLP